MSPRKGQKLKPEADRKTCQLVVRITQAEMDALNEISERQGLPVAHFVRVALQGLIRRYRRNEAGKRGRKLNSGDQGGVTCLGSWSCFSRGVR